MVLLGQTLFFLSLQVGLLNFLQLKLYELQLLLPLLRFLAYTPIVPFESVVVLIGSLQGGALLSQPAKAIEQRQLLLALQQDLLLMLPENVDKILPGLLQHGHRSQLRVDVAPAATLREHPFEQECRILNRDTKSVKKLGEMGIGGDIEQRLYQGGLIISPQHVRVCTLAQNEAECPDNHGFSSPGLTGKHIESGTKLHHSAFYQRIVFNV